MILAQQGHEILSKTHQFIISLEFEESNIALMSILINLRVIEDVMLNLIPTSIIGLLIDPS